MIRRIILTAAIVALAGCNFAPPYQRPQTANPDHFKEMQTPDTNGGWKTAEPREDELGGNWWEVFHDATLNDLESKVAGANQNVIAAEANFRASRALVDQAEAGLFPTLSFNPSATRSRSSASVAQISGASSGLGITGGTGTTGTGSTSPTTGGTTTTTVGGGSTKPHTIYTAPLEASYQVDLWGSVRNDIAQNRFNAEASAAQVGTAILTNQSQLAQNYFELRVTDELRRVLAASLEDFRTSLHLVETLVKNGIQSEEDLAQAQAQLHSTEAQATDLGIVRAQYEHAIAVLIGVPPASFSIPYERVPLSLPDVPVGVPSDLLERRPDIATSERQVAASNAQIGIARAAFFPTLTLGANAGYESTSLGKLFDWPNRFWSLGPSVAATIFDGGARSAQVHRAWALNDQAVANYRQTVLSAFQSVEDNLASLRILSEEVEEQRAAAAASRRAVQLSVVRYRNGVDSYVNVITAQNSFLGSRQAELQVELRRLVASVTLINNLGGGWSTSELKKVASGAQPLSDKDVAEKKPAQVEQTNGVSMTPANPPPVAHDFEPDEILKLDDDTLRASPPRHR
jgi:NodT family efflux transporter outer membrane factor (OMF) lipoprotein